MAKFIEVRNRYGKRALVNLDYLQGMTEQNEKCVLHLMQVNGIQFGGFTVFESDDAYDTMREMIASATGGIPMQPMEKREKQA